MGENKLVVVGIDPGTTTGYCILDLDGNIVALKSSKNLGLNGLLEDALKEGKAISVGTDKAKVPNLVSLFSAKTGARIFYPKEDLRVEEKRELTKKFDAKIGHENDALAASLFAFNRIKGIIERIESYAKENGKQAIKNRIIDLVITKEVSIREAADIIEDKGKEEAKIIKDVVEKEELRQRDFIKLYHIIKRQEKELFLLRRQNHNLKNYARNLENKYNLMRNKDIDYVDKKIQKSLSFKNKSINFLECMLDEKNMEIKKLKNMIFALDKLLANIGEHIVLKKLDNLGSSEFYKKANELKLAKGDILLVKNPNIISNEAMQSIKDKVEAIVTEEAASRKIKQEYGIAFLDRKGLNISEFGNFAAVPKAELEKALRSETLLKSVIESYKQKRKEEITSLNP